MNESKKFLELVTNTHQSHTYDLYVENDVGFYIDDYSFRISNITSEYYFYYSVNMLIHN